MLITRSVNIPNRVSKKFEFYYAEEFFNGVLYPLKEGRSFSQYYLDTMTEIYTDIRGRFLVRVKNPTLFARYKNAKGTLSRELYLKPFKLELNKKQKEDASVTRAFARQVNIKDGCIFEVNPKSIMQKILFFDVVNIKWKLNGSKDEILLKNTERLKKANKSINGISDFLDPLELYEEELTPQQLVEEKLNIIYHNPYSYKTSEEASDVLINIGLSGTHQMSDGTWMPGSSHEAYLKAMGKKRISSKPKVKVASRSSTY